MEDVSSTKGYGCLAEVICQILRNGYWAKGSR